MTRKEVYFGNSCIQRTANKSLLSSEKCCDKVHFRWMETKGPVYSRCLTMKVERPTGKKEDEGKEKDVLMVCLGRFSFYYQTFYHEILNGWEMLQNKNKNVFLCVSLFLKVFRTWYESWNITRSKRTNFENSNVGTLGKVEKWELWHELDLHE